MEDAGIVSENVSLLQAGGGKVDCFGTRADVELKMCVHAAGVVAMSAH